MAGHDKNINKAYRADQSVNICLVLNRLRDLTVQPARLFLATKTSTFQTVIARPDNTLHDLVEVELFQIGILNKRYYVLWEVPFDIQRYVLGEILYISIHRHDHFKFFIGGFSNQKEKQILLE